MKFILLLTILVIVLNTFITSTFAARSVTYRIDPSKCSASPVCCCAQGVIIVEHSDVPGKVQITADLPGGPNCGGKSHVSSLFDIVSPTMAAFAEPGTPLQVKAAFSNDFSMISFSNNLQPNCASIGNAVPSDKTFSFTTLGCSGNGPHNNFQTFQGINHHHNGIQTFSGINHHHNGIQTFAVHHPQQFQHQFQQQQQFIQHPFQFVHQHHQQQVFNVPVFH